MAVLQAVVLLTNLQRNCERQNYYARLVFRRRSSALSPRSIQQRVLAAAIGMQGQVLAHTPACRLAPSWSARRSIKLHTRCTRRYRGTFQGRSKQRVRYLSFQPVILNSIGNVAGAAPTLSFCRALLHVQRQSFYALRCCKVLAIFLENSC